MCDGLSARDHRDMATMYTIEIAERDNRAFKPLRWRSRVGRNEKWFGGQGGGQGTQMSLGNALKEKAVKMFDGFPGTEASPKRREPAARAAPRQAPHWAVDYGRTPLKWLRPTVPQD
jgi:hypothetical protein